MDGKRKLVAGLCLLALASPGLSQRGQYDDRGERSPRGDRGYGDGGDRDGRGGRGRPSATFFTDNEYRGRSVTIDRATPSFRQLGINDKASSIVVDAGRWLVCADDNFRGRCRVVDGSVRRLSGIGLEQTISSARPLDRGETGGGWGGNGGGGRPPQATPLPGGSWAQSCRRGDMAGTTLRAECNDGRGNWRASQIDPRQCQTGRVGNRSGALVCE